MKDEKCTTVFSDLIEIAEKDAKKQIEKGQRLKVDKFTASSYAKKLEKAYPGEVKASHFRTARTNAKKIRKGEVGYVTTPCFTLRAFVSYLMTVEGSKDWPGLKIYINNKAPELSSLLEANPKKANIGPVKPLLAKPIVDWEPEDGRLADHIIRVGEYVRRIELENGKHHQTIQQLMKDSDKSRQEKTEQREEFISLLTELHQTYESLLTLKGTGTPDQEKDLENTLADIKQKIDFYKKI